MGRTSRYKKIKSFDPYSKQNNGNIDLETVGIWGLGDNGRKKKKRSKTAEKMRQKKLKYRRKSRDADDDGGFDLAPSGGDEFDMNDLVGSVKKQTLPTTVEEVEDDHNHNHVQEEEVFDSKATNGEVEQFADTNNPNENNNNKNDIDYDEKKVAKLLKLDEKTLEKPSNNAIELGRKEGESKSAYNKRVQKETRQIIKRERMETLNPEKRKRKKEFLSNKKKNKKKKGSGSSAVAMRLQQGGNNNNYSGNNNNNNNQNDDEDDLYEDYRTSAGDQLITAEQAVAMRDQQTQVRFGEQAEAPPMFRQLPRGAKEKQKQKPKQSSNKKKNKANNDKHIQEQQKEMEKMRKQVQLQYAIIKAKRKQRGDFHL